MGTPYKQQPYLCKESFGDEAKDLTEPLNKDIETAKTPLVLV